MSIAIEASVLKTINFAACRQSSKIIPSITIKGNAGQEVILNVRAVPAFFAEYKEKLTLVNGQVTLRDVPVHLDDAFYRTEVVEAREATIQIEVMDADVTDKVLEFQYIEVHLQPYLHWNRTEWEGSMTAFVQPNDPLVARVLNRAGEIANEEDGRMVGYQTWPNSSTAKQAEWIFRALQEENIHYLCPPAGFEFGEAGQKIRIPGMVLNNKVKQGTCLDLAVLYASCLEAASLNAIIFLIWGHAFTGVWLDSDHMLGGYPFTDWETISEETHEKGGCILPVECTFYTDGLNYSFETAVNAGKNHLMEKDTFHCALDVNRGRCLGYVPAYTYTNQPICDLDFESGYDKKKTIADPIIEHMRAGESVLFVTEKAETMQEVADMLNKANLSRICCLLPDGKESMEECPQINYDYLNYLNLNLSRIESEQASCAVGFAMEQFNILQQKMQQFLDDIGNGSLFAKDKEALQKTMALAAMLKKCPVYGNEFCASAKASDAKETELLRLTREMMNATPGSYRYESVSTKVWDTVEESLGNLSGREELSELQSFVIDRPYGGMSKEKIHQLQQGRIYTSYVEDLLKLRMEASFEEKEALENIAAQIAQGNGTDLLEKIEILNKAYTTYVEAQKRAESFVVSDSERFADHYPAALKIELLNAWKTCKENLHPYKLFKAAPNTLKQLFPCILTGPETAAECLSSQEAAFDVIIFDGESQLPAYKELIPVLKGKECLFIGDEK